MLLQIPNLLSLQQIVEFRKELDQGEWGDGRVTAGYQSSLVKHNQQLPEVHPTTRRLGDVILCALEKNPLFISAALPLKVFPPLFNRYGVGESFGMHIDGAIRQVTGTPHRVRTDLSATVFLNDPSEYDGGELVVDDALGTHSIKLEAGSMILYPASSLHQVMQVTRGVRLASFFWIQSMIRDDGKRTLLFDLDSAIQVINRENAQHKANVQLTGVYHNLLRRWADA